MASLKKHDLFRDSDELLVVDTGSHDNTPEVVEKLGGRCVRRPDLLLRMDKEISEWLPEYEDAAFSCQQIKGGVLRSFAEARNIAMAEAKNEIQFWIDAVDVLEEEISGGLRKVIDTKMAVKQLDTIYLDYDYSHDVDGRCIVRHKRERVYRRSVFEWKGPCHEVIVPKLGRHVRHGYFQDLKSKIVHKRPKDKNKGPDMRNYLIMRRAIAEEETQRGRADPRLYFYFANSCRGLKRWKEAIDFYKLTLKCSGSRDDCFLAAHSIALINMTQGRVSPAQALHWAFEAVKIKPQDPRGYFAIQNAYFLLRRWVDSLWYFEVGCQLPEPGDSLHAYNPEEIRSLPYMIGSLAAKEKGDVQLAARLMQQAKRARPDHPETKELEEGISNWVASQRVKDALEVIAVNTGAKTEDARYNKAIELAAMLPNVPHNIENMGLGHKEKKDTREGPKITFYLGRPVESWGPKSAPTGHAGSERAVWEMSRAMARKGFVVTVYADVPHAERGMDDAGVLWQHFSAFDKNEHRDTIVYWRSPQLLEIPFPAEKRVLWCHDVQNPDNWTDTRVAIASHVFVLSEYHKSTLGGRVPDDKLVVTRNGVDAKMLRRARLTHKKNPKKIVFTSSPDRGVYTAIRAFRVAREEDPDLELHVFYGFQKLFFEHAAQHFAYGIPDMDCEMNATEYYRFVADLIDQTPGVVNHGRCSWAEMADHFAEAGIWLYPTRFDEISCISAMEAQAAGCCIVANDRAALKETVDWEDPLSFLIDPEDAVGTAKAIIEAAKVEGDDPRRGVKAEIACDRFSWETLADEWAPFLRTDDALVEADNSIPATCRAS